MYRIEAKIVGLVPLRYNRYIPQDRESANKKKMTRAEQMEDALSRSYRDESGKFYIPSFALRSSFINGGKKVKVGRGAASKMLEAILIFDKENYYIQSDEAKEPGDCEYKIMEGIVRIPPKTGARVVQFWVVIEKWSVEFTATVLDPTFPSEAIKDSIAAAGLYYGLLDGRPQLGRFGLVSFQKVKI